MKISNMNIPVGEKKVNLDDYQERRNIKEGIYCRDPYIMLYDNTYYLYKNGGDKLVVSFSDDLENWSQDIPVFVPSADFHGVKDMFWAPECHYYKGNFYIFTSVHSKNTNHKNISVYRADNPLGPFVDIANGCITPPDWETIDGTLYVDEENQPWMIFVHEWPSMPNNDGSFVAAKLSDDFTHFISEPIHLFYASEMENAAMTVTDGCYMAKLDSGKLMMIWSNFTDKGYVVAKAYSESGKMQGPWKQEGLLYEKGMYDFAKYDGGHAMIFQKKDGTFALTYHTPNTPTVDCYERMEIKALEEIDNTLKIKE